MARGKGERGTHEAIVVDGVDVLLLRDHVAKAAAGGVLEGDAGGLGPQDAVDVVASNPSGTLIVLLGSPSCTMMRWYGWKKGRHISKKSRFLIVGITMSSSSFSNGVPGTDFDDESFAIAALPDQNQNGDEEQVRKRPDKSKGGVVDRTLAFRKAVRPPRLVGGVNVDGRNMIRQLELRPEWFRVTNSKEKERQIEGPMLKTISYHLPINSTSRHSIKQIEGVIFLPLHCTSLQKDNRYSTPVSFSNHHTQLATRGVDSLCTPCPTTKCFRGGRRGGERRSASKEDALHVARHLLAACSRRIWCWRWLTSESRSVWCGGAAPEYIASLQLFLACYSPATSVSVNYKHIV
ncbi:hypothetical protein C4D60_Mb04t39460 [Musa balbisiana]|uniref:Uncharacterized protein n=1 Tax=Musa balbisiana TaxID=52838 RepID=A0A4S8KHX5_MUSBA|nr:hypothetical protein C4D60_Mb04t39460 [Musa balbisiana]